MRSTVFQVIPIAIATCMLALAATSVAATDVSGESAASGTAEWGTDFEAALARAASEDRAILVNFTGSDWCVWCHRLSREVFEQRPFIEYAATDLVLLEVDFPRRRELPAALLAQNRRLAEQFEVSGYPTILLLNSAGKEIGRLGYMQGGAKTFVRELKRLIAADRQ